MGPCWHTCPRLCCLFPLHKASACQASHRLKFLLLLASVVPQRPTALRPQPLPHGPLLSRLLCSSTGAVLTLTLSPHQVSGSQGIARPVVCTEKFLSLCSRLQWGTHLWQGRAGGHIRKAASMLWASPPSVPITGLPLLSPHPTAAALAPVSSADARGWGPACGGRCRQECTLRQHSLD